MPGGDDARDAHLLAALRHAPDRDLRPPADLSATILRQAQLAVAASSTGRAAWRERLREAGARLWQPAPMAAFGTLALATLIGVMWGVQDVPEASPGLRPAPAAAPARGGAVVADRGSAAAPSANAERSELPAREAAAVAPRARAERPQERANDRPVAKAAEATPPPAPATAAALPRAAVAPQADERAKSIADAAGAAEPSAARARGEMAPAALGAAAPAATSPLAPAAAEIEAALQVDAARVRWRVGAQRLVTHDAAQREWWTALARATQGRWQAAAGSSAADAGGAPIALLIDGVPRGSLNFEPRALVWRDADGRAWRAPVAAETLREAQDVIARW